MKKFFQIIITCAALTILFFNHYNLVYTCESSHEVTIKGNPDYVYDKCDEYSPFPSDVSQDSLMFWKNQIFPDIFTILVYIAVLYFIKDINFKIKKKKKDEQKSPSEEKKEEGPPTKSNPI
ncbi:MAG: hypothetical protein V1716_03590 [Candidatus Uhrbacteria bacterium]